MAATPHCPKISVLLPTYNAGASLLRAAESILGQSMGDLELLVYDDGSTDDTPQILERLAKRDGRVRRMGG
ncbi:MAG: glycosyltransferase, partial [Myxococcota bacterium]|nr:glycosyltransferase [Myxococcota bacterium]